METLTPAPQQTAEEKPKFEIEKLREFVKLENEVKDYKAKIKANEAAMDALELEITPMMVANGTPSLKVDNRLVYLQQDVYASPLEEGGRSSVIAAMKSIPELALYVAENYNATSFLSWIRAHAQEVERECKEAKKLYDADAVMESLPEVLRAVIKVGFKKSLRSRKA